MQAGTYYFDNGATSFPKAPGVAGAMSRYLNEQGVNIGRGSYGDSVDVAVQVLKVRGQLCRLLGHSGDARSCVFSAGVTMSLNQLLQGLLQPGDHWILSAMEHNAVARVAPLLERRGVSWSVAPCDEQGRVRPEAFAALIRPETKLAAVQHASNVSGTVQDLAQLGQICRDAGIFLIADCAQTAGHVPVKMDEWGLSAVAVPGHKGLLGPQGVGAAILTDALAQQLQPWLAGGTGSQSDSLLMPAQLPDRLEAGTLNLPGIVGLGAALDYLEATGVETLQRREQAQTAWLLQVLGDNPHLRLPGPDAAGRTGVISVDFLRRDNGEAAYALEQDYGILTRCGLHCAPLAHRTLGTYPQGTVRLSPGRTTPDEALARAVEAIEAIC